MVAQWHVLFLQREVIFQVEPRRDLNRDFPVPALGSTSFQDLGWHRHHCSPFPEVSCSLFPWRLCRIFSLCLERSLPHTLPPPPSPLPDPGNSSSFIRWTVRVVFSGHPASSDAVLGALLSPALPELHVPVLITADIHSVYRCGCLSPFSTAPDMLTRIVTVHDT